MDFFMTFDDTNRKVLYKGDSSEEANAAKDRHGYGCLRILSFHRIEDSVMIKERSYEHGREQKEVRECAFNRSEIEVMAEALER